jgi:hypothetical protein
MEHINNSHCHGNPKFYVMNLCFCNILTHYYALTNNFNTFRNIIFLISARYTSLCRMVLNPYSVSICNFKHCLQRNLPLFLFTFSLCLSRAFVDYTNFRRYFRDVLNLSDSWLNCRPARRLMMMGTDENSLKPSHNSSLSPLCLSTV